MEVCAPSRCITLLHNARRSFSMVFACSFSAISNSAENNFESSCTSLTLPFSASHRCSSSCVFASSCSSSFSSKSISVRALSCCAFSRSSCSCCAFSRSSCSCCCCRCRCCNSMRPAACRSSFSASFSCHSFCARLCSLSCSASFASASRIALSWSCFCLSSIF